MNTCLIVQQQKSRGSAQSARTVLRFSRIKGGPRDALRLKDRHRVVVAVVKHADPSVAHHRHGGVARRFLPHHRMVSPRRSYVVRRPHQQAISKEVELRVGMGEVQLVGMGMVDEAPLASLDRLRELVGLPYRTPRQPAVPRQRLDPVTLARDLVGQFWRVAHAR